MNFVVLDVENLSYRNHYSSHRSKEPLKVVRGLLRDLGTLSRTLQCEYFCFCFDSESSVRKEIFPDYKKNRVDSEDKRAVREQVRMLREEVLPDLGCPNLFLREGAEADDVMGFLCKNRPGGRAYTLVTTDTDVYQLLTTCGGVSAWDPHSKCLIKARTVLNTYDLNRIEDWARMKAITGCKTDDIPGVPLAGPKSACKYLNGVLCPGKTLDSIRANLPLIERNSRLVTLPCGELQDPKLDPLPHKMDPANWDAVVQKYGMSSLAGKCP